MAPPRSLALLSPASQLWRIWTIAVLLVLGLGLAAETPKPTTASTSPLFTDQEWEKGALSQPATAPSAAPAATSILISVALVAGLAIVLGVLVKRFGIRRIMPKKGRHLEVVEQVTIGYKRAVSLVRIGDQVLVLGQGEHELSHLATLPASILDQPRPAAATAEATPAPPLPSGFRKALDQALGRTP